MKISYGITVCNELKEIQILFNFLLENKRKEDEIVILFDKKNGTNEVWSYLKLISGKDCSVHSEEFDNDFSNWKNILSDFCNGDYIFQIDADEVPHKYLILNLPLIIESNPNNDLFLVPRINTVEGLTKEHVSRWNWSVNSLGWVNYPDYQTRIWKKIDSIGWVGQVHERLRGYNNYSALPDVEEYSLYHPKDIERQEKQNNFYSNLIR